MASVAEVGKYQFIEEDRYCIDVCKSNGNLLASDGSGNVNIFDKRESKIVQTFEDIHMGNIISSFNKSSLMTNTYFEGAIHCVRWSPSGEMLATASSDMSASLLDFKTGKKLYTGKTSDNSNLLLSL